MHRQSSGLCCNWSKFAADGSLVLAPRAAPEDSDVVAPNVMLSDRDVYLTDLRSEIIALGMKAEYRCVSYP